MGQYASMEINASFKTKAVAKKVVIAINGFNEWLKSKGETVFDTSINEVTANGCGVTILLDSSRAQNAEWQADKVFELVKEQFKKDLLEFDATENTPSGYIYYNSEDEE